MTKTPLVSIIVNSYNYEKYVAASIESALNQNYDALEVIVVDDGSTDNSRNIINSYGDRIRTVFKERGGQTSAINQGFAACSGDLIFFLDSDDVLWPYAVSEVVKAWRPELVKIQFNLRFVNETGRPIGKTYASQLGSGDLRSDLLKSVNIYPPTTGNVYSRKLLEKLFPIPERTWLSHSDAYLAWLAPFYGHVLSIVNPLGDFRLHGANNWKTSGSLSPERIEKEVQLLVNIQTLLKTKEKDLGIELTDNWLLNKPPSLKVRLAYVLNVSGHALLPYDTRWSVTTQGLQSVWRFPRYNLLKRLAYSGWFLAVGILPRSFTGFLQRVGLNPRSRSGLISSLTQ